jgi:hypothetical protein
VGVIQGRKRQRISQCPHDQNDGQDTSGTEGNFREDPWHVQAQRRCMNRTRWKAFCWQNYQLLAALIRSAAISAIKMVVGLIATEGVSGMIVASPT